MKILFISLGCDKNLVDSEVMLGLIREKGFDITNDEKEAEVVVVNTCCFINDAKEESIQTILEMAELKKTASVKALIVTGCLAQRYREDIDKEIPEVDAIIGTTGFEEIVSAIEKALQGEHVNEFKDVNYLPSIKTNRISTTGGYYSYLKIAEGCDKHCTYCIIPSIRGNYRSVPMEDLLEQVKNLADQGTKELIIVAQETTLYGIDIYGVKSLPKLLQEICKVEGIQWVRILYCYPEEITDELIEVIRIEDKICKYLDIPIQHASDPILKKMGRRTSKQELKDIVENLRLKIPEIALRTTLITGFPSETIEQHEELMEFINDMEFDRLGVFPYSPEEGTPAAEMDGQVTEEQKRIRLNELMELQQEIVFDRAEKMIGRQLQVMIEGRIPEDNVYVGRTYMDAPNVDGCIFLSSDEQLMSGDFVSVVVTEAKGYDLIAEAL